MPTSPLTGTYVFSPDPAHTEILALAGFDFVIVDTEHAALEALDVLAHVRAASRSGIRVLARARESTPAEIGRLLDTGAGGVVLPHFGVDLERSAAAIAATRYAPDGERPTCTGVAPMAYGLGDFATAAADANRSLWTIGLIEDRAAVERIDEVLATCPPDFVSPGTGDLSMAYGVPGQQAHPDVLAAARRVVRAARASAATGVAVYVPDAESVALWADEEVDLFVVGIDYRLFGTALRDVRARVAAAAAAGAP